MDSTKSSEVKYYKAVFEKAVFPEYTFCGFTLFVEVYCDGKFFRDHCWVKFSKRLKKYGLKKGDIISFSAKQEKYIDVNTLEVSKIGLRHLRNISIISRKNHTSKETL